MNPIRRIYTFFHKNLLTKTMAIGVVLALMGTTCLIQLANIQLVNGKGMAQAAAQSRTTTVTLKARRGKIMDTNGAILAQSVERYTIIGNPEQAQAFIPTTCTKQTGSNCHQINGKPVGVTGAAAVARLLAPVLGMDATELGAKLSISGQYVVLKKDVTPAVKRKISKLNLGGIVYAELSNERLYSNGTLMGSLLGGVDADGKGVAGIEQMENKTLTGRDGYQVYQQGNSGVEIPGTMTESKDAGCAVVHRESAERQRKQIPFRLGHRHGPGRAVGRHPRFGGQRYDRGRKRPGEDGRLPGGERDLRTWLHRQGAGHVGHAATGIAQDR